MVAIYIITNQISGHIISPLALWCYFFMLISHIIPNVVTILTIENVDTNLKLINWTIDCIHYIMFLTFFFFFYKFFVEVYAHNQGAMNY